MLLPRATSTSTSTFVSRAVSTASELGRAIRSTPAAHQTLADLDESVTEWIDFVSTRMSASEVEEFTRLLDRVREIADSYRGD